MREWCQRDRAEEMVQWLEYLLCKPKRTGVWIPRTMQILDGCGSSLAIPTTEGRDRANY